MERNLSKKEKTMYRLRFLFSAALLFCTLQFSAAAAFETTPAPVSHGVEVLSNRLLVFHT
jgi:hypothetical protein